MALRAARIQFMFAKHVFQNHKNKFVKIQRVGTILNQNAVISNKGCGAGGRLIARVA